MTAGIVGVYGFGQGNFQCKDTKNAIRKKDLVISAHGASQLAESDGIVAAFEGKIYNIESSGIDEPAAAALIQLYRQHGIKFIEKLDAKASIFLIDTDKKRLIIVRDELGQKPIYYAKSRDSIAFASTQKDLIDFCAIDPKINKAALYLYLYYGYVPTPTSLVEGISKIPASTYCIFDKSDEERMEYWTQSFGTKKSMSLDDAADALEKEILSSISKSAGASTQVGLLLSGGLDSSTLLALSRQGGLAVNTYTISIEGSIDDESKVAETVARLFETNHKTIPLKEKDIKETASDIANIFDEPFSDPSLIPTSFLYSQVKDKVVFAGDGGDELLGGYPKYYAHRYAETYRKVPKFLRRLFLDKMVVYAGANKGVSPEKTRNFVKDADLSLPVRNQEWVRQFDREELGKMLSAGEPQGLFSMPVKYSSSFDGTDPSEMAMFIDTKLNLVDQYNMKVDASARHSHLNVECPLLDKRLFKFAAILPIEYKIRKRVTKVILRKLDEKYIPLNIINRPKTGFGIPLGDILKTTLREQLRETLTEPIISKSGISNSNTVMSLMMDHLDGRSNNAKKLWTVFALIKWIQARERE
jgi:asparagine synthase (glutamine-hydrolysing)